MGPWVQELALRITDHVTSLAVLWCVKGRRTSSGFVILSNPYAYCRIHNVWYAVYNTHILQRGSQGGEASSARPTATGQGGLPFPRGIRDDRNVEILHFGWGIQETMICRILILIHIDICIHIYIHISVLIYHIP